MSVRSARTISADGRQRRMTPGYARTPWVSSDRVSAPRGVLPLPSMPSGWASGLVVAAVFAAAAPRAAGSAPRPLRLTGHWGQPTPIVLDVAGDPDVKGDRAVELGRRIWHTAVAPGGKFALLHVDSEAWNNGLMVLAVPEGRIVRALPGPEVRMDAQSFALSADGRWGLFAGQQKDAIVWDTERGLEKGRLTGPHTERVTSTAIAPNGRWALTGDEKGGVALWSMPDRKLRHRFSVEDGARTAAFSPDSRRGIVVGRQVVMFDVATGKEVPAPRGYGPFDRVVFTPDGKRVVLASAHNNVMTVSDAHTGQQLQMRREHPVPAEMTMAVDGRSVVGQARFTINRWNLDDLSKVDELGRDDDKATGTGMAAGGRLFFTTNEDGQLKLWDATTGKRIPSRHRRAVTALTWTPDGNMLLAGASDGTLTFWSAAGKRLRDSTRHDHSIYEVAVTPSGTMAVSTAGDAALWPLPSGGEQRVGGKDDVELEWAAFAADGQRVIVGGDDGAWSSAAAASPSELSKQACDGALPRGPKIAIDRGQALLGVSHGDDGGGKLHRLNLTTCKSVWSSGAQLLPMMAVAPDATTALVADRTGTLQLFRLADGALIRSFDQGGGAQADDDEGDDDPNKHLRGTHPTAVAFLVDKQRAMSGDSAGGITLWDLATGKAIAHSRDLTQRKSLATAIAARPGGRTVAVGTNRGEILIFTP